MTPAETLAALALTIAELRADRDTARREVAEARVLLERQQALLDALQGSEVPEGGASQQLP